MKTPIKLSALSFGVVLLMLAWAPLASAYTGFEDGCQTCHAGLHDEGPDHDAHALISNDDCGSCHDGVPGRNNPPLANCVRCHGRDADAGGDTISAGLGRGLRQHHENTGTTVCGLCHGDATGAAGVGEDVLPSFYSLALNGAGLDSCNGSEDIFLSLTVSLDNDGDGNTDSADSDCAVNTAPVANAGLDQTVNVGDTVTLDGSNSSDADSDPLTYSWSLTVPGGSGATLSDAAVVGPTFVPDVDGTYTATLVVNDGMDDSAPTDAVITAQVVVVNNPPVADAGLDQNVTVGDTVTLDGSGSSDADSDPLTYSWSLSVPGGSGATLSDTTAASPTFVADVAGDYVAQLIVNDGTEDSAADTAMTTASAVPVNNPPVANAGPDENVTVNDTVVLDGSGSTDADGDPLTYLWSLSVPGGSVATLSDPTVVSPTFVADVAGDYVAQLIVNDSTEDSVADTVMFTASAIPVNNPPVADAGLDQSVVTGDTVTLDGNGSSDADGDALTYSWSLSVPMGSAATLSDPTAAIQTFVSDVAGDYVLQLIVNDGMDDSTPDSVVITVALPGANQPPVANAGPDQSVVGRATVTLDGSGSSDPDVDPLAFSWSLTSAPAGSGAVLSDATVVDPSIAADVVGDYVLQLIVNDGEFDSAPDTVMVTVVHKSGGGAISLTFVWLLGLAVFLTRRRSIGLQQSAGKTSGS
ncbi:MAG: PKD domain-containing protein [Woeseiaceae bacterium]|nr:PKD domain-containing protein [Woeseiaceae bacterium]